MVFTMSKIKSSLLVLASLPLLFCSCSNEGDTSQAAGGGGVPAGGQTANTSTNFFDEQGLAFYPLNDGTYAVSIGHAIYLDKIVIPAEFNDKAVTEMTTQFSRESSDHIWASFTSITIPSTIRKIGYEAIGSYIYSGSEETKTVEEIIFQGSVEQFSQIEFDEYWLADTPKNNPNLKFTFSDKTFTYSQAYTSMYASINGKKYFDGDTYNAYIGVSTNSPHAYRLIYSEYPFIRDFSAENSTGVVANTSIVTTNLKAVSAGSTTYTISDGTRSAIINIVSSNPQNLPDNIYAENEIVDYDGQVHFPTKPIHNVPEGAKVYIFDQYYAETDYNVLERYYYNEALVPSYGGRSDIGYIHYYAVVFKPGYKVKSLDINVVINHKAMNDYVISMSQNNHLYVHLYHLDNYDDYYVRTYNSTDVDSYVRFDWVAVGAYVDIDLSQTYDGGYNESTHEYGGHEVNINTHTSFAIMSKSDHQIYGAAGNFSSEGFDTFYTPLANNGKAYHFFRDSVMWDWNLYPSH